MVEVIFPEMAIAFVIVATLAAVAATTSASPTIRGIASKTVNGSFAAAVVSAGLTAWFLFSPH
jgi:dolichol kinase